MWGFIWNLILVIFVLKWRSQNSTVHQPTRTTRPFGPRRKGYHWTLQGHCGCLVTQMCRQIRTIKAPHQNSNFMLPTRSENELLDPIIEKLPTCCKLENLKFSKKLMNFQNITSHAKKKTTFGTKYLKTHVPSVISKIVFPKPQLDIKF